MLKERSQTFKLIFIFLDLVMSILSFAIAFGYRYYIQDKEMYHIQFIDLQSYLYLSVLLSSTQILAFLGVDLYHPRRGLSFFEEFFSIFIGVLLNLVIILALLFFFREVSFSRLLIIYYFAINILLTSLTHFIFRRTLMRLREQGYNLRKMVILGAGKNAIRISEIFAKHLIYGYKVAGFVKAEESTENTSLPILGNIQDLGKILQTEKPDLVIYAVGLEEGNHLKEAIDLCDNEGIELKIVPGFTEFIAAHGRVDAVDGIPVITIRDIPVRTGYNLFLKRSFDLIFSSLFIIAFSPFYLLIAFLVKVSSKGPIFIFQERVGLDNKQFKMIKFRTMYVQEKKDSDTKWTVKDDPRVTPIGSILRKLSIDETPQFFNVFFGNMSVVGPRPERPFFVEQFKNNHRHYMRRHAVKAGITGWAQVRGLRGDTSIDERIAADIYYIENWSFWLDIKIVIMTPFIGLINKNAY